MRGRVGRFMMMRGGILILSGVMEVVMDEYKMRLFVMRVCCG